MSQEISSESDLPLLRLIPLAYRILALHSTRKDYGLTKSQIILLTALYYRGSLNMTQISKSISSSKEQATRAVSPLVESGFVKRLEHRDDRKHVYIELTERGTEFVRKLRTDIHEELQSKIDASLSPDEKSRLVESVNSAIELLSKIE